MAAMIASRRMLLSKLLETLSFSPLRPAAPSARFFNGQPDDVGRRGVGCAVCHRFPSVFVDDKPKYRDSSFRAVTRAVTRSAVNLNADADIVVADVFDPTRSLSQVLNLMDQMLEKPVAAASCGGLRRGWDVKEDEEALYLRAEMPGLGKEHLKVRAEQNTIVIRGEEGEKESDGARRFSSRIDLPADYFKMDQIKAEMKNGVLKVVVPKAKEEDSKDVFHVNVE